MDPVLRSPSPEPIYDQVTHKRINTRDIEAREKLVNERNTIIEECMRLDPGYKPPQD